jgi:hypothetical protein
MPVFPRTELRWLALASGLTLCTSTTISAQPTKTDTSRALSIEYVDGRRVNRPLRPTGGIWTPSFPRIPGAETRRSGLPLSMLDVRHVVDSADVIVTVSLSYGGPNRNLVKVKEVRVKPDSPVHVPELRAYGVEPITLSIVAIPAREVPTPLGISVSAQLDIRVEPVGPNASAYRVTITNRSNVPLMWLRYQGLAGTRTLTSRPKGQRNHSLIAANGVHTFEIAASFGVPAGDAFAAAPFDTVEITSLMWGDGTVEGDRTVAAQQGRFDASRAVALRAFVTLLGSAGPNDLSILPTRLARSMEVDIETREFKDAVVADLERLQQTGRSSSGEAFGTWRAKMIVEAQRWLERIVLPKVEPQ